MLKNDSIFIELNESINDCFLACTYGSKFKKTMILSPICEKKK